MCTEVGQVSRVSGSSANVFLTLGFSPGIPAEGRWGMCTEVGQVSRVSGSSANVFLTLGFSLGIPAGGRWGACTDFVCRAPG